MLDINEFNYIRSETMKVTDQTSEQFAVKWESVIMEYTSWIDTVGKLTSDQTQRLELIKIICTQFNAIEIKDNENIKELILQTALPVGKIVNTKDGKGNVIKLKVVDRKISTRFGINYVMEYENGTRYTKEFFD